MELEKITKNIDKGIEDGKKISRFKHELEILLNSHSKENDSNTPDFILMNYIVRCLDAFNEAVVDRDKWFNFKSEI